MTEREHRKPEEAQNQQGQVDLNIVLASMREQIGLLSQEKAILYAQVIDLQEKVRALDAVRTIKEPKTRDE